MNLQCTFSVLRSLLCRDDSMWAIGECIMLTTATTPKLVIPTKEGTIHESTMYI